MLSYIYPISFFASLLGLIMWFYFKGNSRISRRMSQLFLGGFFIYLISLAFADATLGHKLLVLARDLLVLGLTSQFFNFFKKNKMVFLAMLVVMFAAFRFGYLPVMMNSFISNTSQVDEQWELLMELNEEKNITDVQAIADEYKLNFELAFSMEHKEPTELDDYYAVNIPRSSARKMHKIKEALLKSGVVDWVEENETITVKPIKASSTISRRKYSVNDPGIQELWGFDEMEVDRYYDLLRKTNTKPGKQALIAILDTGVDSKHEDLSSNYLSIQTKYDKDLRGHGTHCAGIAGAVSNNNIGIASFNAWSDFTKIASVKVLTDQGFGTQRMIINGILEAADKGADVISMSLGGRSNDNKQRAYEKAVKYANQAGAIVVVAAGNNGANAKDIAPASAPGVICVSAVDEKLEKAPFSNHVKEIKYAVAAPGVNIYSTIPGDKYASFSGTSMATPYVSGLIGVLKSINPDLTTGEIYKLLKSTGKPINGNETGPMIQPASVLEKITEKQIR